MEKNPWTECHRQEGGQPEKRDRKPGGLSWAGLSEPARSSLTSISDLGDPAL